MAKKNKRKAQNGNSNSNNQNKKSNLNDQIISLNCVNCNGFINLDINNITAYCPYCGSKLLVDNESLTKIILAREKQKITTINANKEIELARIETDFKDRFFNTSHKYDSIEFIITMVILFLLILVGFIVLVLDN